MNQEVITKTKKPRLDILVLWGGIFFSLGFTILIWYLGPRLDAIQLLPDQGASWYYWKLPEPTIMSRATSWGFYLAHQISIWGVIYFAQKQKPGYTTGLHKFNIVALAITAFFITLHTIQTHIWYDGLAQDVSIWSSQISVIILLIWVLLMENPRRGMFAGKKLPISQEIIRFARKYHGYFFAWATIYTFWYHPTINTPGHLWGFFYMFLLLLQGSLFFTRIHLNKWWTFTLELTVLIHGTIVAIIQGNNLWPMFAFGFGGMIVITQMHGLGLSKWVRGLILAVYIALVIWVYNGRWAALNEIIRIPVIEYVSMLALAGIFALGLAISQRVKPRKAPIQKEA